MNPQVGISLLLLFEIRVESTDPLLGDDVDVVDVVDADEDGNSNIQCVVRRIALYCSQIVLFKPLWWAWDALAQGVPDSAPSGSAVVTPVAAHHSRIDSSI